MPDLSSMTTAGDAREISTPAGILRYYDVGDGPVLLFLHGSGPGVTGWRNFRGVLPAFARQFRCLVLEFPGFGVSDDFGGHPMVTAQGVVAPFLDGLGVDLLRLRVHRTAPVGHAGDRSPLARRRPARAGCPLAAREHPVVAG